MSTLSMLKSSAKVFAAILAVASMSAVSHAQTQEVRLKVNVPFAFESGKQQLPAGVYNIDMEDGNLMVVNGKGGSSIQISMVDEDRAPSTTGKVVFHKRGNRYFLREVWVPGRSSHFDLHATKAEKNAVLAQNETPSNVELALLEPAR